MRARWLAAMLVALLIVTGAGAPLRAAAQTQPPVTSGHETGAAWVNVFYVPGKAILCGLGALGSVGILLISFGQGYQPAVQLYREGCHGKWSVTAADIAQVPPSPAQTQ
jgi:hypothetical protein